MNFVTRAKVSNTDHLASFNIFLKSKGFFFALLSSAILVGLKLFKSIKVGLINNILFSKLDFSTTATFFKKSNICKPPQNNPLSSPKGSKFLFFKLCSRCVLGHSSSWKNKTGNLSLELLVLIMIEPYHQPRDGGRICILKRFPKLILNEKDPNVEGLLIKL